MKRRPLTAFTLWRRVSLLEPILIITVLLTCSAQRTHACSTVLLKRDGVLLVGHNLDETTDFKGFVFVNKRDYYKVGSTWHALRTYSKHLPYSLNWISRYGSVTWSSIGRDLPDAGINERGLVIEEMSLAQHPYPRRIIQPTLFQMQWIQYHLDNFSSVEQVIESASMICPDGWPWHFFVADRSGNCATLEYIDGRLVVHSGATLPVTALCNRPYYDELKALTKYQGFGGTRAVDLNNKNIPRFVRAAHMLKAFDPAIDNSPVDYVFKILENLGGRLTRRSYVVDMVHEVAYYRTESNRAIQHISLNSFDFSCETPVRFLDMDTNHSGDATGRFQDYTFQTNRQIAESWINHVIEMVPVATEEDRVEGGFSTVQIDRYARYGELSLAKNDIETPRNLYGLNALFWAAYQDDLAQVRILLDHGADVNGQTAIGTTPLMAAAQAGNLDVVQHLVAQGAHIDLTDRHGNTPLIVAAVFGQSEISECLIQAGANIDLANKADFAPQHYAAATGDLDLLKHLLQEKAQLRASSESGLTALMLAASAGRLKAVEYLMAQGQDPDTLDTHGNTALLIAVMFKHTDVAQALIQAGADAAIQNNEKETPWRVAAANRDKPMMRLLKKAGVKPPSHTVPLLSGAVVLGAFSLWVLAMRSKKRRANETSVSIAT